jgi:hypothetical protein
MENKKITNYAELHFAIELLKSEKAGKEELIKSNFRQIGDKLNPVSILKSYLKKVNSDNELYHQSLSAILSGGSKFIVRKLMGVKNEKRRSFVMDILDNVFSGSRK